MGLVMVLMWVWGAVMVGVLFAIDAIWTIPDGSVGGFIGLVMGALAIILAFITAIVLERK